MGRGYLEGGVWKQGKAPSSLNNDPSFSTKKLDPSHKYVLYVSTACPFAHSANIARVLKGLEGKINVAFVEPFFGEEGWVFGSHPDPIHPNHKFLHQVYTHAKKDYTGRVSVPVLYDVTLDTIASNESMECIELFNDFGSGIDLYAPAKDSSTAAEFEKLLKTALSLNGSVYGAGMATTQEGYVQKVHDVFNALDLFEEKLGENRFIFGTSVTAVDIRVFVTYLRFIYVYRILFKLDKKDYTQYKNLNRFVRELYQNFSLQPTAPNVEDIKAGYYKNFDPTGIVAVGPDFDLNAKF